MHTAAVPASPLVSVIIPCYNRADVLGETIDSVFAQSYPNIELIVVDDGSSDGTSALLDSYGDRLIAIRQKNQRLAAARNAGHRRAKGDYIAWLDHDDLWNPEKVAIQVAYMQQMPDCSVSATDFSAFDAKGFFERSHASAYYSAIAREPRGLGGLFPERLVLSTKELPSVPAGVPERISVHHGHIYERIVLGNYLHPPTLMMTRAAVEKAGDMEQRFGNDVDYEYILRLAKIGRAAFIDHPMLRYRYSEGQLSSDQNMVKIALSLLSVLEMLDERDPALRESPTFKRRIAHAHLQAAHALAEKERGTALRHLLRSVAGRVIEPATVSTLAKLCLPQFIINGYRERRRID
jgi:glycosyltransferase involved in cell wall biosynthesis